MILRWSLSGMRFYAGCEGNVLHPYPDSRGIPTIFVGHVIHEDDHIEPPYTQEKSDYWLRKDGAWAQAWLWKHCPWTISEHADERQHNFDACMSLVLNAGHVFDDVLAEINGPNRSEEVKRLWMSHTRAGNDPKALAYRRAKEVALYLTPEPPLFDEREVANVLASVYEMSRQIVADDVPA